MSDSSGRSWKSAEPARTIPATLTLSLVMKTWTAIRLLYGRNCDAFPCANGRNGGLTDHRDRVFGRSTVILWMTSRVFPQRSWKGLRYRQSQWTRNSQSLSSSSVKHSTWNLLSHKYKEVLIGLKGSKSILTIFSFPSSVTIVPQ